jgi:predicted glycosyltransferase involved in capsule biosynthesis
MLTTITPYWNRPEQLLTWVRYVGVSTQDSIRHLVYFVGEAPPEWWTKEAPRNMVALCRSEAPGLSIGHYHNLGAQQANTEWIMKLDVDALPHVELFSALLEKLRHAKEREWFNVGMVYINSVWGKTNLGTGQVLTSGIYNHLMQNLNACSANPYRFPAASNFVCRREDYLNLGGCDPGFLGYGWEDYQQLFMLEKYWRQGNPLPTDHITLANVTQLCRDHISRTKALELWRSDPRLCLLHRYHRCSSDPVYWASQMANRHVLFNYVRKALR